MRLLAIVRLLEVIGEAANGVSEEFRRDHPELPWQQMVATRNRLIHGYRDIDPSRTVMPSPSTCSPYLRRSPLLAGPVRCAVFAV